MLNPTNKYNEDKRLIAFLCKRKQFSFFKILVCIYIEGIHRKLYDGNCFKQRRKATKKEKRLQRWYNVVSRIYPEFRPYLRYQKQLLKRAYNQKRLSFKNQIVFRKLLKINTERYHHFVF